MNSPFVSVETQQLGRVLDYLGTNEKLAEKGENLPATLRQLGVGHSLMHYYGAARDIYKILIKEIGEFDAQILASSNTLSEEKRLLERIKLINALAVQHDMMLLEHLISFAEEFRRVAKIFTAKKNGEPKPS